MNDGHQENVKIKIEPREQEYPEISEDNSKSKQSNQINENNWVCFIKVYYNILFINVICDLGM